MKLFMGYMLICFVAALAMRGRDLKANKRMLFALVVLVCIGYAFFNQI